MDKKANIDIKSMIQWGEMVEIAYNMYDKHLTSPKNLPSHWQLVARLTIKLKLGLLDEKETAGFFVKSTYDSHTYAIVLRGSDSIADWFEDLEFCLDSFVDIPNGGKAERGFIEMYRSVQLEYIHQNTPSETLISALQHMPEHSHITLTGHSMGGAVATLHALVAANCTHSVELVTFGSPRIGDEQFVAAFHKLSIKNVRIYNLPDMIPRLPLEIEGYYHVDQGFEINSLLYPEIKHNLKEYHALHVYLYVLRQALSNFQ